MSMVQAGPDSRLEERGVGSRSLRAARRSHGVESRKGTSSSRYCLNACGTQLVAIKSFYPDQFSMRQARQPS